MHIPLNLLAADQEYITNTQAGKPQQRRPRSQTHRSISRRPPAQSCASGNPHALNGVSNRWASDCNMYYNPAAKNRGELLRGAGDVDYLDYH
jgi:hypothetical protein